MVANLKKKILISAELASSEMGSFFQKLGFELKDKYVDGQEYAFIVENACPEVLTIPRLQAGASLDSKLAPMVRSFISPELLASEQGQKLLTSYFEESSEFDLVDRYSKEMKDIYSVKIHDYLNIGFFIDSIIAPAYKAGFNIEALRSYLNTALDFAFKKIELEEDSMPIDISYSHNGDAFVVQISLMVASYSGKKDFEGTFDNLVGNTNYFDVTYFHKKQKLTLSSLSFRDQKLKNAKAHFFTEISRRTVLESAPSELYSGLIDREHQNYRSNKKDIIEEQSRRLANARKFAIFIKVYHLKEEHSEKSIEDFEISDVEHYLTFYPRQEALADVDLEIKNFLLKLLKDDQLFNGISEYVEKIANSNLDDQVQEIQRVLGTKSLSDIEEILRISGSPDKKDDPNRTSGWSEKSDEIVKISGNKTGLTDEEIWEIRKGQLNIKIQNEVLRVKSEGRNIIQDDIVRVMAKELSAHEDDVKIVVSGIVEEVISSDVMKNQKMEESFALKIASNQNADHAVREKLESQVFRMKKIMDQLKRELIKLQTDKNFREQEAKKLAGDTDNSEILKLKNTINRSVETLQAKDRFIEKIKHDFELLSKVKDTEISKLEEKIDEMKLAFAASEEAAYKERAFSLENEKKMLLLKLELANKKVNTINENLEHHESETLEKREKELESLKSNLHLAQTMIEHLKIEKTEIQKSFKEERENFRKYRDDNARSEASDKEKMINTLNAEKKLSEDKYRTQAIELKKTEQKLKFAISQLESAQKKNAIASGQKSAETHVKQVEQANARLSEATAEVSEKRKEIVKLKQENSQMSLRLTELERKLTILEKKAA